MGSSVVRWFSGTVVRWFSCSVVQWYGGSVVQWFSGSVVQWFSGTVVQGGLESNIKKIGPFSTTRCRTPYAAAPQQHPMQQQSHSVCSSSTQYAAAVALSMQWQVDIFLCAHQPASSSRNRAASNKAQQGFGPTNCAAEDEEPDGPDPRKATGGAAAEGAVREWCS